MARRNPKRQAVADRLALYNNQFDDLMTLLLSCGQGPLPQRRQRDAQAKLKSLKQDLRDELRSLEKRYSKLNPYEIAFLEPALRKTGANMASLVPGNPGSHWLSDLYCARLNIINALRVLEREAAA